MNKFSLTKKGIMASIDAANKGIKLMFTHIAIGRGASKAGGGYEGYTTDGEETELKHKVAIEPTKAGRFNSTTKQLELNTLFRLPDTETESLAVFEVGVFVENSVDKSKPILALIWSGVEAIAHLSTGGELYFSVSVKLSNIDTNNITIAPSQTDFSMLLKSEFDKFLSKKSVQQSFDLDSEKASATLLPSYILAKGMNTRLSTLEAEKQAVDIGAFPKYFAPADTKVENGKTVPHYEDIILSSTNTKTKEQFKFKGGSFYILGQTFTLPPFETEREISFDITSPHTASQEGHVIAYGKDAVNKAYFVFEVEFTEASDIYTISSLKIKAIKTGEYNPQDLRQDAITSPLQIKIAELTKGEKDSWDITKEKLSPEPMLDTYATLKLDAQIANHYKFTPTSHYNVEIINKQPHTKMGIETNGIRDIHSSWKDMELAKGYVEGRTGNVILEVYTDSSNKHTVTELITPVVTDKIEDRAVTTTKIADGNVTTSKISPNAITATKIAANAVTTTKIAANAVTTTKIAYGAVTSTKIAYGAVTEPKLGTFHITMPIGSIIAWHKHALGSSSPLTLPSGWEECNGQYASIDGRYRKLPNLNNKHRSHNSKGSFLRGHTVSGELETDAMQDHKHIDAGHEHIIDKARTSSGYDGYFAGSTKSDDTDPIINTSQAELGGATAHDQGTPRTDSETRAVNMSVVWIMRIS